MHRVNQEASPQEHGVTTAVDSDTTVASPFRHICSQHVDEIAHLWSIWSSALKLPHYDAQSLAELEKRVQAHIAGVRVHGDEAWRVCAAALDIADAGEIFAAAQIAFRSYDPERVRAVVEAVEGNSHLAPGLVSALTWLPGDIAHPWLKKFLDSKQLHHKTMALMACFQRGEDPAAYLSRLLQREDCLSNAEFVDAAMRCVGAFKRQDLRPQVLRQLKEVQGAPPYATLFAGILLDEQELTARLKTHVFAGPSQGEAIELAFRVLNQDTAREWIREMVTAGVDSTWTIQAAQALGDTQAVPWLIGQMREPAQARLAGHAFYAITGVDLVENNLTIADPTTLEQKIEQELTDESAEMPNDEHLSWPDVDKIWHLWRNDLAQRYPPGKRYLLGAPPEEARLKAIFATGFQPQRHAAALELALLNRAMPLANAFTCVAPER